MKGRGKITDWDSLVITLTPPSPSNREGIFSTFYEITRLDGFVKSSHSDENRSPEDFRVRIIIREASKLGKLPPFRATV
jgi:hypothetical protein